MKQLTAIEYLKALGVTVDPEVAVEIKSSWDLDCAMDAAYVYCTDHVDLVTFHNIQEYCHAYFNGNIDENDEEYIDLSCSLTADYTHYILDEIPDETLNDGLIVEVVGLEDESRYYEIPED